MLSLYNDTQSNYSKSNKCVMNLKLEINVQMMNIMSCYKF